jgi:hypothetical protein
MKRVLTTAVIGALLLAGPLAPLAAAQQPAPPAPTQPMQPAPDLFQEALKAQQVDERGQGFYDAGAVVVNAFLVPGRVITCVLGGATGLVVLGATLGTAYRAASAAAHEGCGGKWLVTGDDLRPQPSRFQPFDWEQR